MPGTSDHTVKGKVCREGNGGEEEYKSGQKEMDGKHRE